MNQLILMLTAYLALVGQPDNLRPVGDDEWQSYKLTYDKSYENQQIESLRRSIYAYNKATLESTNVKLLDEGRKYQLGVNQFTDLTPEELYSSAGPTSEHRAASDEAELDGILGVGGDIPDELDWTQVGGRVADVKNQGQCAASWAFGVTGVLEGQEMTKHLNFKRLVDLSEQNLLDCIGAPGKNHTSCFFRTMEEGFDYVRDVGLMTNESYPYTGTYIQNCTFDRTKSVISGLKGSLVLPQDEEKLKETVAKYGPVAASVFASFKFNRYGSGIFSEECKNATNHVILIVGYGRDEKNTEFWIGQNSWATYWGEQGYIRIERGKNNCCIAQHAVIAKF